jgi:hypothetical protein
MATRSKTKSSLKINTNWKTLHIFWFGDVQVITEDGGGATKKVAHLTKLQAVIDNVWSTKLSDVGTKEYHAINVFENMFADWQPNIKGEKGFRTQYAELDAVAIQELVDEVLMP